VSKTLIATAATARDLCRDAFGNGTSGQEERSLRYIALAIEQLDALIHTLEDRNDSRRTSALERLTRSMRAESHPAFAEFPDFDASKVSEAFPRWMARNLPNPLRVFPDGQVPEALQEAVRGAKPGEAVTVKISAAEFEAMLKR
jgi:hypothetical protein